MLENLRRQGSSVFIYAIFGILIAMFVINFRPGGQSGGDDGCSANANTAISIDGDDVSLTSFRVAYQALQGPTKARTEEAFELMIRRELLASAARAHGLIPSDTLIDDQIKNGMFFLGGSRDKVGSMFESHDDGTQTWSLRGFKDWVARFNVSLSTYRDEQQREFQGSLMAQIAADEVHVSRDEALNDWLYDHNTVTYDSVVFRPEAYAAAMHLTDDDIARFLATHEPEVKARYTTDLATFDKPAQIKVREIYIAKSEPAAAPVKPPVKPTDAGSAAGSGAGSAAGSGAGSAAAAATKKPAHDPLADAEAADSKELDAAKKPAAGAAVKKPAGMPIAEAKAKLEAALADVKAGKKKFADVARELSTEDATKWNGGELGWRDTAAPALGDKAVNDAVKTLKDGETTPVIVTDRGVYAVTIEGTRSGKLAYDAVKLEIAAAIAKQTWPQEAARRDAIAAIQRAQAGKSLDQIFERETERPEQDDELQKILNDPSIPDKSKKELLQQYLQMQQRHGSLTIEGKDQPVAWYADSDGPSGGGSAPAPKPAPAAGGSAATTPASPAPAPAAAADLMKPSSDTLPSFGTVAAPKVNKNGPTPKEAKLPGIGTSKAAADALFDELAPGSVAKTVYFVEGNYVVLQLLDKATPKVEDFDKESDHVMAELRTRRSQAVVEEWLRNRCDTLAKANRITWSKELLRETSPDGKPIASTYRPCESFHRGDGGLELGGPDAGE